MNYNWTVLCPGKSLSNLADDYELCPMRTIAVNHARLIRDKIGFWAMQDYEVFSQCEQGLKMGFNSALWIPDSWLTHWHEWRKPWEYLLTVFHYKTYTKGKLKNQISFANHFGWDRYTIFTAIAFCILNHAHKIDIIGMDLQGEGYFKDDMENDRTIHNDKRWMDEEYMFKTCQSHCQKNGISIRRIEI